MSDATVAIAGLATALTDVRSIEEGVRTRFGDEHVDVSGRKDGSSRHIKEIWNGEKLEIMDSKNQFS